MKTTRRYHRSILKKYTRRKSRVASFKSLQTDGMNGGKKLRLYLLEYTKFWKAYKFHYSTRDTELIKAFLKQGPVYLLKELDQELLYYHSYKWDTEKTSVLFAHIVESYIVRFLEPKMTTVESTYFISEDFYIDSKVLTYKERFLLYHQYINESEVYEIKNACCDRNLKKEKYHQQALNKLKKALGLLAVSNPG